MDKSTKEDELLDELFTIGNLTDEQFRQVKRLRAENERLWAALGKHHRGFVETPDHKCGVCRRAAWQP